MIVIAFESNFNLILIKFEGYVYPELIIWVLFLHIGYAFYILMVSF